MALTSFFVLLISMTDAVFLHSYGLSRYGPGVVPISMKPSIRLSCTNSLFSCSFPNSWIETCWIQSELTTTTRTITPTPSSTASSTTSSTGTPAATLYSGWYYVSANRNCTVAQCGACFDPTVTVLEMSLVGNNIDSMSTPALVIMPNYTASWDNVAFTISKNDQTYTLLRGPAVCRITLSCFDGECARWAISTATTTRTTRATTATTTRPSAANAPSSFSVLAILALAVGIGLLL